MTEKERLQEYVGGIQGVDAALLQEARKRQETLAKPLGSLGVLEEMAVRLFAITKGQDVPLSDGVVIVCAADHGVVKEGVSVSPKEITAIQAVNMTRGLTGVGAIAQPFHVKIMVADVGIATPYQCDEIIDVCVRKGSGNLLTEDALTREEVLRAILAGISLAERAIHTEEKETSQLIPVGVGEMGIGNTTAASAVLAVLTNASVDEVTGYGGGLTNEMYAHKVDVISRALKRRKIDREDVLDVLCAVGGADLAAMCGVYLGAAYYRMPVVIDGFLSAVAALAACKLSPYVREYLFASHASKEPGFRIALDALDFEAPLQMKMRLGEGSGCPLAFQLMKAAWSVHCTMATFEEARIDTAYLDALKQPAGGME